MPPVRSASERPAVVGVGVLVAEGVVEYGVHEGSAVNVTGCGGCALMGVSSSAGGLKGGCCW